MESLVSDDLSSDWPSSPGGGGEPVSEGTSPQISARSGGESDASAMSQAVTGTPASGAGDAHSEAASPLIDCSKLLQRSRALCSLRLAGAEGSASGFVASLGPIGQAVVTTASALSGFVAAGSAVAVFEMEDGRTREVRLEHEALLWSDEVLNVAVVACRGLEGVCEPLGLSAAACSADDDLLVVHPEAGRHFSFHRVVSAGPTQLLFSSPTAARPVPGLPVFCGSVVAGLHVGVSEDGSLCRAVPVHAIVRGVQAACQPRQEVHRDRNKSAPSSRSSSAKGRKANGLPPRHTADVATSPIASNGSTTKSASTHNEAKQSLSLHVPCVEQAPPCCDAVSEHTAVQPPAAQHPPMVRALSLPVKLHESHSVVALPASHSYHDSRDQASELRPSTPPQATPAPAAPRHPNADSDATDASGAVWSSSSASGRVQRVPAALPSVSLPVMSISSGGSSAAAGDGVQIFPVQNGKGNSEQQSPRRVGGDSKQAAADGTCSRVLDAEFRASAEGHSAETAAQDVPAVAAEAEQVAADADAVLSDHEGSSSQRTLDDVEEESSRMTDESHEAESQAESSVPASPERAEPAPAIPHNNALEAKLQEAGPQVLVHILAHCPEQHILQMALARVNAMLAVCQCEGPCSCSVRLEFERMGGVSALIDVARRFASCEQTQVHSLGALGSLALCHSVQRVIAMDGGVQMALGAMSSHPESSEVNCLGCKLLCNLAFEDEAVQMEVCVAEGVESVVRAMRRFNDYEQVQAEGCGALCNLAASVGTWDYVRDGEGIAVVVDAMKTHDESAEVQFKGCCALCSMSGEPEQNEEAVGLGAIDVVIKAMLSHPNSAALQYKGCSVLLNLAQVSGVSQLISRKGGVAAIFKAPEACDGDVHLACKALRAVRALCNAKETFGQVARSGGVWSVVQTMKRHSSDEEVQIRGISVLGTLCRDSSSLQVISEQEGLEAICTAAKSMSHSETLLIEACSALSVLSLQQGAIPRITETGVLETVRLACKGLHADSDAVHTAVARLERALMPRDTMVQLEGQARDTRDTLTRRMLSKSFKSADRRPISATLALTRPQSGRPSTAAAVARKGGAGHRRPASATFAGKDGFAGGNKDELRGSLKLQHQILTLKKEAESLRRENLQIMAGAVSGMAETPELSGVNVDCTISSLKRLGTPVVHKDTLVAPCATGAAQRVRPASAHRLRASAQRVASPYMQPLR